MRKRYSFCALLMTILLSSCAALPTSGPVVAGKPGLSDSDTIVVRASGPIRGSSPEKLVRDFKQACNAGPFEDFSTARLYLSETRVKTWNPREKQIILAQKDGYAINRVNLSNDKEKQPVFSVTGQPILTLDKYGRKLPDLTTYEAEFKLVQEKGEWRIAELPNEVAISSASFQYSYSRRDLFFVATSNNLMVSDPRWLPRENMPRRIVEAILAGPSPSLEPGLKPVMSFKNLKISQVEVDGNEVQIAITQDSTLPDVKILSLLKKQLFDSLSSLAGINDVVFYYHNKPVDVPMPESKAINSKKRAIGINEGNLVLQDLGPNSANVQEDIYLNKHQVSNFHVRWPAVGMAADSPIVALGDEDRLLLIKENKPPVVIFSGKYLRKPVIDRYNWIWTGSTEDVNSVRVIHVGETNFTVPIEGLPNDSKIAQIQVDSYGIRAIASVIKDGSYFLYQMVIVRNSQGKPEKIYVEAKVAEFADPISSIAWIEDTGYAVLVKSNNSVIYYPINSFAQEKSAPSESVYLINNPPEKTIQILNRKLGREELRRQRWVQLSSGLKYLSYSG